MVQTGVIDDDGRSLLEDSYGYVEGSGSGGDVNMLDDQIAGDAFLSGHGQGEGQFGQGEGQYGQGEGQIS